MPVLALASTPVQAGEFDTSSIHIESGVIALSRNDVRIPGDTGTRFDMLDILGTDADVYARVALNWKYGERAGLRVVASPLEITGEGSLSQVTSFAGETFAADTPTNGTYRFNGFRLTWRYTLDQEGPFQWAVGVTGFIRDAEIALSQGELSAADDNVGFVPALHLSGEWRINRSWMWAFDFDGLAGGPGRLIDLGISGRYILGDHWHLGVGGRILEGGADVDEVFNFAQLNFLFLDVGYRF